MKENIFIVLTAISFLTFGISLWQLLKLLFSLLSERKRYKKELKENDVVVDPDKKLSLITTKTQKKRLLLLSIVCGIGFLWFITMLFVITYLKILSY